MKEFPVDPQNDSNAATSVKVSLIMSKKIYLLVGQVPYNGA